MTITITSPAANYPTALSVRQAARAGTFTTPTAGVCPQQVQANLLVLPSKYASDFRGLCKRNPVSCPLLGENVAPGDPRLQARLAEDSDIRNDAPGYNVYMNGKLIKHDIPSIEEYWKEDSVAFLIGCSFTFEQALADAGLVPRHQEVERNVPMYRTSLPLLPSGIFKGNTVVSMRPYKPEDIERVRAITRPYLETHGEPIAWGEEAIKSLGIADINNPEFGDPPIMSEGEVPVFWGCGVTPQLVVMSSPECQGISIGHAPGKMVCLDLTIEDIMSA